MKGSRRLKKNYSPAYAKKLLTRIKNLKEMNARLRTKLAELEQTLDDIAILEGIDREMAMKMFFGTLKDTARDD